VNSRGCLIIIFLAFFLFLISPSDGFDNDFNWVDPNDHSKGQKQYTREQAIQGEYYGGHDTITSEAALLKKTVHSSNQDFKNWIDEEALPS